MGRARYLIVVAAVALLGPAGAAAAEAPQIYVGSAAGYTIAFKVADAKAYVLGLDATVDCQLYRGRIVPVQAVKHFFPAPKLMRPSPTSPLTAREGEGTPKSLRNLVVEATLEGEKVVGTFEYFQSEEGEGCHSGSGPFSTEAKVPFEAVRYEPASGSPPPPPVASTGTAVYYGIEGPVEALFTVSGGRLVLRGDVGSECQRAKGLRAVGRGPLSAGILEAPLTGDGSFLGKPPPPPEQPEWGWRREAVTFGGSVADETITGTYHRRIGIRTDETHKQVCHTGPLPLRAQRYLPATL